MFSCTAHEKSRHEIEKCWLEFHVFEGNPAQLTLAQKSDEKKKQVQKKKRENLGSRGSDFLYALACFDRLLDSRAASL
jgi:hypothetical protein